MFLFRFMKFSIILNEIGWLPKLASISRQCYLINALVGAEGSANTTALFVE